MALRIQVSIQLSLADGTFNCSASYRDTVTKRASGANYVQPDTGVSTTTLRNTILQTLVNMCNLDNATGAVGETTNATVSDVIPNG